jgi:glucose/mannose-6-phosphate isomerase
VGLPRQLRDAHAAATAGPALMHGPRPARVVVVGMGGSAIGGDFLRQIARERSPIPVDVVRGDRLPRIDPESAFLFFVSYSGNTEETLACWREARAAGLRRAVITSGGVLAAEAAADRVPTLRIPSGSPPRAALGWTSVPLLVAMERGGLLSVPAKEWEESFACCEDVAREVTTGGAPGAALEAWARSAQDRFALVYAAADPTGPAAMRWACQINENAKALAHVALFPEQNHNEIVGWERVGPLADRIAVIVLDDPGASPGVRRRLARVTGEIEAAGIPVARFAPRGESLPARLFSFAILGDFASLALAGVRGVDPTPVASIDRLKAALASGTMGDSTT